MDKLRVEAYFPSVDEKLSIYSSDPEDNNREHCHDFNELVIVDSGHGLHVINGKPVFIQEGDVFFVRDNDYHFYDELGTLKLINVLINPQTQFHYLTNTEELLSRFSASENSHYGWLMPEVKNHCRSLIGQMFENAPDIQTLQQEGLFFQLIMNLVNQQEIGDRSHTQYKLHRVLNYLQEHCFSEINWIDVADEFLLTQRTLFRRIKETTGMTPENYLKRLRLVSARMKIKNTETSITDIAFICGFSNSNHFTACYKKVFGITPSQERKIK
ncbi:AraC family L-rhamnose operon regulatory protein RhaS [Gibbsiella quercinecans]|uniref:Arabinose operon regulatory protein n=1 Tax=Gibbsiella quercinecans TaxID=929813 RepID=A0A250B5T0_9GAMM|nr:helix-turn-helix domain-containing protein [Gibbsiella quercinecans]ATA21608.1 AraC family transcriptional regulator [Gibbsiella quercinecans]RLM06068.1 AraC family transcriptional regulator [Gibbsiella quercinecans]RLM06224.1 AraC family transcriptional regulator [Gibbsiella quercinecans]TCT88853.1 AraC family L-rhamnose operon regulatory protein RhaS [Gibbsiella quercinecans]